MMRSLPFELLIGLRYIKAKRKQRFISIISAISIMGVAVGVTALMIVLGVMNGFQEDIREKILGFNSHIMIQNYDSSPLVDYQGIINSTKGLKGIVSMTPTVLGQAIVKSEMRITGVAIRGLDPDREALVSDIGRYVVEGNIAEMKGRNVFIGTELAKSLGVGKGDSVVIVSPAGSTFGDYSTPYMEEFAIIGLFKSGMYEYDSNFILMGLEKSSSFLGMEGGVSGLSVKIKDIFSVDSHIREIYKSLKGEYWIRSWKMLNSNLFSALKLEKIAMFIMLALIIMVAAFNIMATLIMIVMEKNREIGILKSLGASNRSIMAIFMVQGMLTGVVGLFLGLAGGFLGGYLISKYNFITLPGSVYYISKIPVLIEGRDVALIVLSTILLSLVSTIYPSYKASKMDPVDVIRYE